MGNNTSNNNNNETTTEIDNTSNFNTSLPPNNIETELQTNTHNTLTKETLTNTQPNPTTINKPYWTITTTNCRGLNDPLKRTTWMSSWELNNWDIIISTETNGKDQITKHWKTDGYITWWTSDNNKGSGVSIALKKNLADRVININKMFGRLICIDLAFPQKKYVRIIGTYSPASPGTEREKVHTQIIKWIKQHNHENWHIIVGGDFNSYPSHKLDKLSINRKINQNKTNPFFDKLQEMGLIDTFRFNNPHSKEFTWFSPNSASRIDMIWTSSRSTWYPIDAFISDNNNIHTDHKIQITYIETWQLETPSKRFRRPHNNTRYAWQTTNDKQWEKFSEELDLHMNSWSTILDKNPTNADTNEMWTFLRNLILNAANKHINKYKEKQKHKTKNSPSTKPILLIQLNEYRKQIIYFQKTPLKHNPIKTNTLHQAISTNVPLIPWLEPEDPTPNISELDTLISMEKTAQRKNINNKIKTDISKCKNKRNTWFDTDKKKMIQSLMENPQKSIITTKLINSNSSEKQLITDPQSIKNEIRSHYQKWTSKRHIHEHKGTIWQDEYEPKTHIDETWYEPTYTPITIEEIIETIKKTSNKSAPGPSNIPYMVFKHLNKRTLEHITIFFNKIISTEQIPKEWKHGTIYPIPKPKDWQYDINITRPITLLESIKKIFTKIITNRLSKIFTQHQILSEHNWAALPKHSTREPITIINQILEDAREKHKPCYMLFQDMSKAYDTVNINRLSSAMQRIKIPTKLINIITNCFSNRQNTVITYFGNTEWYPVEEGIDQGDTISPILWRIYYDPLITKINNMNGYKLSCQKTEHDNGSPTQLNIPITAYMDDTTFITQNQEDLKEIIHTSSSFYNLNDITVNPHKSELLILNANKQDIQINNQTISPASPGTAIRVLGVWHEDKTGKKHQRNLIKTKTNLICNTLARKQITDKMHRYIINHVLFPTIEYLLTDLTLSEAECLYIDQKIRKSFKHRVGLASSTPNPILHLSNQYDLMETKTRQLQKHTSNLQDLYYNSNTAGLVIRNRIQQLQCSAWQKDNIFTKCPEIFKPKSNFLQDTIRNIQKHNISMQYTTPLIKIPTELQYIEDFIEPEWYNKYRKTLRTHRILWVEQILSTYQNKTLQWQQVGALHNKINKRKEPLWYNHLQQKIDIHILQHSNNQTLNPLAQIEASIQSTSNSSWYSTKLQKNTIIGKRISNNNDTIKLRHYNFTNNSPITACPGCNLANTTDNRGQMCCIKVPQHDTFKIPVNKTTKSRSNGNNLSQLRIQLSPHSITRRLNEPNPTFEAVEIPTTPKSLQNLFKIINFTPDTRQNLLHLHKKIKPYSNLHIYTDGAYNKTHTTNSCGIGIIINNNETTLDHIGIQITGQTSPNRAEILAALIATSLPNPHTKITIETDSNFLINEYHNIKQENIKKTKETRLIHNLHTIIHDSHLSLNWIKTDKKDHNENHPHKQADLLAKTNTSNKDPTNKGSITNFNLNSNLISFWWNKDIEITNNIRKTIKTIRQSQLTYEWTNLTRNKDITLQQKKDIDFKTSITNLHPSNINNTTTNPWDQSIRSFSIKLWNRELPTMDKLHLRRPDLYKTITCFACTHTEDNTHPFKCQQHSIDINRMILDTMHREITARIEKKGQRNILQNLTENINKTNTWDTIIRGGISKSIIHTIAQHLKPDKISETIKSIINGIRFLTYNIWLDRCNRLHTWEQQHNITQQDKKKKRKAPTPLQNKNKSNYYTTPHETISKILLNTYNIYNILTEHANGA
jgi:exonuclease III